MIWKKKINKKKTLLKGLKILWKKEHKVLLKILSSMIKKFLKKYYK